jgi:hypothetical protein
MGLLAGIVEGALGGAGLGVQNAGGTAQAAQYRDALAQHEADLERQKLDYAAQIAEQRRAATVQRVHDAIPGIVDAEMASRMPAPSGQMTDTQLAADQAQRDALRQQLATDPHMLVRAAESTGDVPYGTAATTLQRGDNALLSQQWHMDHNDTLRERTEERERQAQADRENRLMYAQMIHDGHSRDAQREASEEAKNARAALADMNRDMNMKRLQLQQLQTNVALFGADSPQAADAQTQMTAIQQELAGLESDRKQLLGAMLGPKAPTRAAPPPPPGSASAMPDLGAAPDAFGLGAGVSAEDLANAGIDPNGATAPAAGGLPKGWTVQKH